jgi:hypothetical protein
MLDPPPKKKKLKKIVTRGEKIKVLECPEMARFVIKKIGSRRVCRRAGGSYPILTPPGASADASGDTASEQLFQKCSDWAKI